MKRYLHLFALTLVFVTVGILLAACGNSKTGDDKNYYRVTFDTCGGTMVTSQRIEENGKVVKPYPNRDGYDFMGWYIDASYSEKFDFGNTINKDTTLYAKWSNDLDELYDFTVTEDYQFMLMNYHGEAAKITLPTIYHGESITAVGPNTFVNNADLTSVIIPESYTVVHAYAFKNCLALQDLQILGSLYKYGNGAFYNCQNLQNIYFATLESYSSLDKDSNVFYNAGATGTGITLTLGTNVHLPANLLRTTTDANLPKITSLMFVDDDNIVLQQFTKDVLPYITCIDMPDHIKVINYCAFASYPNLSEINFSSNLNTILPSAFSGYSSNVLTDLVIPSSVTTICENAFIDCTGLTSITILNRDTDIFTYAFRGCKNLKSIIMPDDMVVDYSVFPNVEIVPTNIKIANFYIDDISISDIEIPNNVISLARNAFANCTNLTSVIIPDGVTNISAYAFNGCYNLNTVFLPDSITTIEDYAFSGCTNLTSITIPNGVTEIGSGAFANCQNLTSIVIPSSVKVMGWRVFSKLIPLENYPTWTIYCERPEPVYDEYGYEISADGYQWAMDWCFDSTYEYAYEVIWNYKRQ